MCWVIRSTFNPTTNQGNSEIAFLAGGPVGFSCSLAFSSYIRILVKMGRDTKIREQSSQENKSYAAMKVQKKMGVLRVEGGGGCEEQE